MARSIRCAVIPPLLLNAALVMLASCANTPNPAPTDAETARPVESEAEPSTAESAPQPDATPKPSLPGSQLPTSPTSSSANAPAPQPDNSEPTVLASASSPADTTATSPESSAPSETTSDSTPETPSAPPAKGACGLDANSLRVTHLELEQQVIANEDEAALKPVVISPKPGGGSRVAFMGDDENVHVIELDEEDQPTGVSAAFEAHDFADLHADDSGGVLLLTRNAPGGGTLNCGEPTNLCGEPPDPAIPCFDMHLVRFDDGHETWATQLTDSSVDLPSYSTSETGPEVVFVWWYAHHGRIAFDGERYASYFGAAISVSQGGCINIHQGDRMKLVDTSGQLLDSGFGWGCSHSGYERVVYDPMREEFVAVCKTDNQNRIAFAPDFRTIKPVDLAYSNFGDIVLADGGGYWLITSDAREGQPAGQDGLADIHLLHATDGEADQDIVLASSAGTNYRAPHLSRFGSERLLAAWETSGAEGDLRAGDRERRLFVQTLDAATGAPEGEALDTGLVGNRYHALRSFPDGSVAFVVPGATGTSLDVLRVLRCE